MKKENIQIENIINKIKSDLENYGYLFYRADITSNKIYNYSFNLSINFNKKFDKELIIKIYNQVNRLLIQKTFNYIDFDGMKTFLINFEDKI